MSESDDRKIGMAILEEVESEMAKLYGDTIALGPGADFNVIFDVDNKELQKKLDIAEKKLEGSKEGLAGLNFLRGRLTAIKQSPMGNRAMVKCGEYYSKAIELGYDKAICLYFWGMHNKMWNNKEAAIKQFQEVVDLLGIDKELGMEAAKEIEKTKEKKSGCFIATAAYGSADHPDVIALRTFRDDYLLPSRLGKLIVKIYYFISPPLAQAIRIHPLLRNLPRKGIQLISKMLGH
jgi:hypothetical protein